MKRLLIVEDDPNTLSGLLELLSDEGYKVYGVTHGNEALKVAAKRPFDMVLSDYSLPDINGLQVCRELKRLQPGLMLFLTTAFYDFDIIDKAREYGISKIFTKPIIVDIFLKILSICSDQLNIQEQNAYTFDAQKLTA